MPEDRKAFDLGEYVEVKDRIKLFYELYAQGRLVTEWAEVWEHGDKVRVVCKALAYRDPDDPYPAVGFSWMEVPGTTPYTRGSELENTETSAWGRAIAALGILVDRSIASANEIAGKQGEAPVEQVGRRDGLIGIGEKGKAVTSDYLLRKTPDGHFLGLRLKGVGSKAGLLLEAHDAIAEALALVESDVIGQRLQVWGHYVNHELKKGGSYDAYVIERIQTPTIAIPAPDAAMTPAASGTTTNGTPTDRAGRTSEPEPESLSGSPSRASVEEAGASVDTAEAPLPEEAGVAGPTDEPPAAALCRAVGSDFGTVCGLPKGHANKHKELATDGRVLAAW